MATELTKEELDFIDNVKSADQLSAGVLASVALSRKVAYINRHGFDAWQRLCMSSSQSYGIRK